MKSAAKITVKDFTGATGFDDAPPTPQTAVIGLTILVRRLPFKLLNRKPSPETSSKQRPVLYYREAPPHLNSPPRSDANPFLQEI